MNEKVYNSEIPFEWEKQTESVDDIISNLQQRYFEKNYKAPAEDIEEFIAEYMAYIKKEENTLKPANKKLPLTIK